MYGKNTCGGWNQNNKSVSTVLKMKEEKKVIIKKAGSEKNKVFVFPVEISDFT